MNRRYQRRIKTAKLISATVESLFSWMIAVGIVWLYAWLFKPNLTSGSVWFIAALFAAVSNNLSDIKDEVRS